MNSVPRRAWNLRAPEVQVDGVHPPLQELRRAHERRGVVTGQLRDEGPVAARDPDGRTATFAAATAAATAAAASGIDSGAASDFAGHAAPSAGADTADVPERGLDSSAAAARVEAPLCPRWLGEGCLNSLIERVKVFAAVAGHRQKVLGVEHLSARSRNSIQQK